MAPATMILWARMRSPARSATRSVAFAALRDGDNLSAEHQPLNAPVYRGGRCFLLDRLGSAQQIEAAGFFENAREEGFRKEGRPMKRKLISTAAILVYHGDCVSRLCAGCGPVAPSP